MHENENKYPIGTSLGEGSPLQDFRQLAEKQEEEALSCYASYSRDHSRYFGSEEDHRLPYKRDVDRIVHSKAYARYVDKTQVAYLVDNDHITHRGLHVQLVSNFARGIAEILKLNLDLVEAVALGHDVGHPPFGHEGEEYLSALSEEYGNGPFTHPYQSCRLFMDIEPLNLGLAVYDGILCHDGGMQSPCLEPNSGKTWDDHFLEKQQKLEDPDRNIIPGTLEGCLVKLCDTMSYLGRDIEDAISLGIITRNQIPQTGLGMTNREILSTLAQDLICSSYNKKFIAMSDSNFDALKQLRAFNFKAIYSHQKLKTESAKVKRGYRLLFETLLKDYQKNEADNVLWRQFLHNKSDRYLAETEPVAKVIDYISGMTNSYFYRVIKQFYIPSRIELPS